MQALLPLLPRSRLWAALHPAPVLVSLHHAYGSERPRLAGSTDDEGGDRLSQARQLLPMGGKLRRRSKAGRQTTRRQLATRAGSLGEREPSVGEGVLALPRAVLLVGGNR